MDHTSHPAAYTFCCCPKKKVADIGLYFKGGGNDLCGL